MSLSVSVAYGHCSGCGKVWTLETAQGVCQWCGKLAQCQTAQALRSFKSSRRRKHLQFNRIGEGYDQLPEPHLTYYRVALPFAKSVPTQDGEDLLDDIIYHLARANGHKPLSEAAMYRTASHVKDHYWYSHYEITNGLDCRHCSKAQRHKCREDYLYPKCRKAIKLESLNKPIIDSEGNITELGDLIADDKALDLDAWVDARTFLLGAGQRLKGIAVKIRDGENLTPAESRYLYKWRRREQKRLI